MSRRCRGDRGSSAVEFALTLPLVIGIIAFGIFGAVGVRYQGELQRAAEVGARAVAIPQDVYFRDGARYRSAAEVHQVVNDTHTFDVTTLAITDADGNTVDPLTLGCGDEFRVRATFDWPNPFTGLLALLGLRADGTFTMSADATGVRE